MSVANYQYEPLPVPSEWGREERLFLSRLTDVLDDIYLKWGRISENDLSVGLRKKLSRVVDSGELENYSTVEQTEESVRTAVGQLRVGGRNLLLGTAHALTGRQTGDMGAYALAEGARLAGETARLSFDWEMNPSGSATATVWAGETVVGAFHLEGREGHESAAYTFSSGWTGESARVQLSAPTGEVTVKRMQLEKGGLETDWGQAEGELVAGSGVEITRDAVRIQTEAFEVGCGGNQYMALDAGGGYFPKIASPQVAARYDGPALLLVNSENDADGETYFSSLAGALERLNGKWLDEDVTVRVESAYVEYGAQVISGLCGGGSVTLEGGGMTVCGPVRISACAVPVTVRSLKAWNQESALRVSACAWVLAENCEMETGDSAQAVALVENGSTARLTGCALAAGRFSLWAKGGSRASVYNCSGNRNLCSEASFVTGAGTLPSEAADTVSVTSFQNGFIQASGTPARGGGAGTVTIPSAAGSDGEAALRETAFYWNAWNGGGYLQQGYAPPGGQMTGCMWFDVSGLNGKAAASAKLRLSRVAGWGKNSEVALRLVGLAPGCAGSGGVFGRKNVYGVIGSIAPGATKTFTIPTQAAQDLIDGSVAGLALFAPDSQTLSGVGYSENYARFYGTAGGPDKAPKLTVSVREE